MTRHSRYEGPRRFERDHERGGRMRSGADWDRYRSGNERRYSPDWDDRSESAFDGDRSYAAGGYAEEFGERRRGSRDTERGQGQRGGDYADEPQEWGREQRTRGMGDSRLRWEDAGDDDGYFGTGSYYGAYGTQPGSRASGRAFPGSDYFGGADDRWRRRSEPDESARRSRAPSGDFESHGRSVYGAQSGYGRQYGAARQHGTDQAYGQDYHERFGTQRYGRNPEFGYGFDEDESTGTFRGRGPKGYQRSDERMKEIVCERLTDDPRVDASEVSIEVKDRTVKLTGTVPDRRTKYEIEDIVERWGGTTEIDNQLRVASRSG